MLSRRERQRPVEACRPKKQQMGSAVQCFHGQDDQASSDLYLNRQGHHDERRKDLFPDRTEEKT